MRPERDQPARPERQRQRAVVGGPPGGVAQRAHALVVRLAGLGAADVLEQERHAPKRPVRERPAGVARARSNWRWITLFSCGSSCLDAGDGGVDELDRMDVATSHELGDTGRVVVAEVVVHGPTVSAARGRR